ncbi:MAG: LPS export ABC transporter periplasmic protein LptC [Treponema sp.]|nr:LPS export ABC transporter periplasmic protein LptC [Treponema sp.]
MKKAFILISSIFLFFSCSIKYDDVVNTEESTPELVFQNVTMTRYEKDKVTVEMKAELLEQYKNSSETYGKNLSFSAYDKEGKLSTQGACGLLLSDSSRDIYELYDNIELFNYSEKIKFFANVLKWNSKTEQLTSGKGDMVRIEKEDASIRGTGFSASGLSKSFSFRGTVTGEIETENTSEKN